MMRNSSKESPLFCSARMASMSSGRAMWHKPFQSRRPLFARLAFLSHGALRSFPTSLLHKGYWFDYRHLPIGDHQLVACRPAERATAADSNGELHSNRDRFRPHPHMRTQPFQGRWLARLPPYNTLLLLKASSLSSRQPFHIRRCRNRRQRQSIGQSQGAAILCFRRKSDAKPWARDTHTSPQLRKQPLSRLTSLSTASRKEFFCP